MNTENGFPRWWTLVLAAVQAFAAIATVAMAVTSHITLRYTREDRKETSASLASATEALSRVKAQEAVMNQDRIRLDESLRTAKVSSLMFRSEAGDRFALAELCDLLFVTMATNKSSEVEFQVRKIGEIQSKFSVQHLETENNFHAPTLEVKMIPGALNSSNSYMRVIAIDSIGTLRLNAYIPELAKIVEFDGNLNVVQHALYVINQTFLDNRTPTRPTTQRMLDIYDCFLPSRDFRQSFDDQWNASKQFILARKPKEIRHGPDTKYPNLMIMSIHDPEKEAPASAPRHNERMNDR